ncbi:MAG: enoyl-CoA hydratase/isomerase family protein [Proteobacteria bacterium]|nr:enoyl-CoA hydratase/isomerase family protein [Pseudomonadota bacterium]MDA1060106.1 enoyl-CoA hydratase/isomerase family protein [Pseudomonadota bacterium]
MTLVRLDRTGDAAVLTLDRAPVNAMNIAVLRALDEAAAALSADPPRGGLVLTGANGVFSAGADIKEVPLYDAGARADLTAAAQSAFSTLYHLPVPTVAALPGHAMGGGMVLALTCDRRLAVPGNYKLGLPEISVGIAFPPAAWTIVNAELDVTTKRRMVLDGQPIDPHAAHDLGIIDELVPAGEIIARALKIAAALAQAPGYAAVKAQLRGTA